jgi:phosphocarrier protein HPr
MQNLPVKVQNKLGLHTRAAAKLVALASSFESKIQLKYLERTADCKSIMAIILLGAAKGITLELVVSGNDENDAVKAVINLFENRFGEPE